MSKKEKVIDMLLKIKDMSIEHKAEIFVEMVKDGKVDENGYFKK